MHLGLAVVRFTWPGGVAAIRPILARIIYEAEQAGVYSLWFQDHFLQNPLIGDPHEPLPESYTLLGFAAAHSERLRLGTLVTGVTYRHPGVLIKQVTTVDVLSGGRAYLGIGAAWYAEEHDAFGIPFPPLRERFERLEETLQIADTMWRSSGAPHQGRHYQLRGPVNMPPPLSTPRPRILIGGGGERRTLSLVARYADACNLFEKFGTDQLRHKLEVLREHCERVGRPYSEIEKTSYGVLALSRRGGDGTCTPAQAVERLAALSELGFEHAIVSLPHPEDPAVWELVAEVAEGLAQVTPVVAAH